MNRKSTGGSSKDLFDDTTMSFGEHLSELRMHLIRALLGITIAVIFSLYFSKRVMDQITRPVEIAHQRAMATMHGDATVDSEPLLSKWWRWVTGAPPPEPTVVEGPDEQKLAVIHVDAVELLRQLHEVEPAIPAPAADAPPRLITLNLSEKDLRRATTNTGVTALAAEEGFLVYLKVAIVTGLVIASPYVLYELWLFVAAGLYPHERRLVYIYLPLSVTLFIVGALFCFYFAVPIVLDYLFDFSVWLRIMPQVRINEWVGFATILPLMFGISFQLPLVMLFLERLSIFSVKNYREQRRMAILVISILSMVLTPSDPISMLAMLIPLVMLYELGILLCARQRSVNPFPAETA